MNDNKQSEVEKFFNGLPSSDSQAAQIFDEEKKETIPVKEGAQDGAETAEQAEVRKNRRHRRLEEALQKERESNIALNERVKTLAEVGKVSKEVEVDPRLLRAFGTTEEGKEFARVMSDVTQDAYARAKQDAVAEMRAEQAKAREAQQKVESFIDSSLENLEEEYNVDLTSDSPAARKARKEFLDMVQKLSPKDSNGEIVSYADFDSTFEVYQSTRKIDKSSSENVQKQKEIASRSMQRAGGGTESSQVQQTTPGFFGWRRDLNIQ